jgi:HSP20 family protein
MEETMAFVHHHNHVIGGPPVSWQRWRQLFEFDDGQEWLRVEEFHDGDTFVVRTEVPDIDPEKDVEVTTTDDVVRIHAHREQKSDHKEKRGCPSEFRYDEFERGIALPHAATADDVKATYGNGVLQVRIPCPEKTEPSSTTVPVTRT